MTGTQGGTKTFQKNVNLSVVLHTIRIHGPVSRIELARMLGLNRSTITHIISYLLETGIVCVDSEGEPSNLGGRKPVFLRINGGFGAAAGLEMQHSFCRAVLFSLDGREIVRRNIGFEETGGCSAGQENETAGRSGNDRRFEKRCLYALREIQTEAEKRGYSLIGAGVGIPGMVNPFTGTILQSETLGLRQFDFAGRIDSASPFPVLVENDANCCALRELRNGAGQENFLYLLPKFNIRARGPGSRPERVVGIGMGIVIGGEIYHGNSYAAGEFRSVFWKQGNPEQVNLKSSNLLQIEKDRHILRRFFREVALNLSPVISVLNPGRIYVGGDGGEHYHVMADVIESELHERFIGLEERSCELVPADYDRYDVACGGGTLVFEKLFGLPALRRVDGYFSLDWETVLKKAAAAAENGGPLRSGAGELKVSGTREPAAAAQHDSVVL